MTQYLSKFQCFSGNTLKIVAIVAMLINHFIASDTSIYMTNYSAITGLEWNDQISFFTDILLNLGLVGKIAFPIFAFLLVEGYQHTHSKKNYALKMLCFALISELPFDLALWWEMSAIQGTWPFDWGDQNVFFTLFLGILVMYGIEHCMKKFHPIIGTFLSFCFTLILSCIANSLFFQTGAEWVFGLLH